MKRLYVVRHGKSTWDYQVRDHDRVLKERGVQDAHLIANTLQAHNLTPEIVWTSSAARALQTATILTEKFDYELSTLKIKRSLYTFDYKELEEVLGSCSNDISELMIVSHNHGLTDFVNELGSKRFENVPTTGVVIIDFDTDDWSNLHSGKTILHLFPKNLK